MRIKEDKLPITAKRLRQLRSEKNWRQVDIAEKIGVSLRAIVKWECGKTLPDTDALLRLSKKYNVSTDYLLGLSDYRTGAAGEYFSQETGLSDGAIAALIENRKSAAIEKGFRDNVLQDPRPAAAYNLLPDVVSHLLLPQNQDIMFLIANYLTADDIQLSDDLPPVLQTPNVNGSGLRLNTADVIRSALPNLILERLHDLRRDRLQNRTKKAGPENPTENKTMKEGNEND